MAINEWKIWRKLGMVKEKEEEEVKVEEDLEAVSGFLKEIEVEELRRKVARMKEMAREEKVIEEGLKAENLKKQIALFEEILQKYSFLENDVDVNGLRLKKIGEELLRKAEERGLGDLVKEIRKKGQWRLSL